MKYFVLFLLIISEIVFCQPEWVKKIPPGYTNDYFIGKGSSSNSKIDAAQNAFEDAIVSIMRNNTIDVKYSQDDNIISTQTSRGDEINLEVVRKSAQELQISGESKTIKGLKEVETYYETENGSYVAWVLVNLPKKNPISPPSDFSPIWRSFLLPGWGQLYKNESFKGISFMTFSIGGVAGGLIFSELSKDAKNKANSSRTQITRDFYNTEAKNYNTYSTISYVTTGVFYVWSLVDAIIVKQDNLYVILENTPYQTLLSASIRF
jgi:hypothetical protein